jgi:hypothetical protein
VKKAQARTWLLKRRITTQFRTANFALALAGIFIVSLTPLDASTARGSLSSTAGKWTYTWAGAAGDRT